MPSGGASQRRLLCFPSQDVAVGLHFWSSIAAGFRGGLVDPQSAREAPLARFQFDPPYKKES
jgi:hypothetical protein